MTSPPRKLLFHVHALETGGAERVMALLASGFAERGDQVTVAVDRLIEDGQPLSPHVRVVALGGGHRRSLRRLMSLIQIEKPDASISALGAANLKHAIAAWRAGRHRRAVIAYHGYFAAEPQLMSRAGFLSVGLLSRLTGRTVGVSDGLVAHLRRHGASRARTARIHNPVALACDADIASAPAITSRPPLVLAAGRLAPAKDFITLLRAFARVMTDNARLRIVGEGPERPALEAEVAALGLRDRVELPGHARDMQAHYRAARCLAITSKTESFGNVAVEALSHGLPVVATDCGGPREIIQEASIGTIVPVGDIDAVARAVDDALANPGDSAPRRARAKDFSVDRALDAYDRLITEMIEADR